MNACNSRKVRIHQFRYKAGVKNKHHILKPNRGGMTIDYNLLKIDVLKHDAFHYIFKEKTLREVIALLKRKRDNKDFLRSIKKEYKHAAFRLLFGNKRIDEIIHLLQRVQRAKDSQYIKLKLTA